MSEKLGCISCLSDNTLEVMPKVQCSANLNQHHTRVQVQIFNLPICGQLLVWLDVLKMSLQDGSSLQFMFDKVHGLPKGACNTQADIFSDIQDIVLSTLEGLNGCVMAYGQTGLTSGFLLAHLTSP